MCHRAADLEAASLVALAMERALSAIPLQASAEATSTFTSISRSTCLSAASLRALCASPDRARSTMSTVISLPASRRCARRRAASINPATARVSTNTALGRVCSSSDRVRRQEGSGSRKQSSGAARAASVPLRTTPNSISAAKPTDVQAREWFHLEHATLGTLLCAQCAIPMQPCVQALPTTRHERPETEMSGQSGSASRLSSSSHSRNALTLGRSRLACGQTT